MLKLNVEFLVNRNSLLDLLSNFVIWNIVLKTLSLMSTAVFCSRLFSVNAIHIKASYMESLVEYRFYS